MFIYQDWPFFRIDTFSGMPKEAENDPSGHRSGDFGDTSFDAVKDYLSDFDFIRFIRGLIPKTFSIADNSSYCFVHIDVDLYQSVLDCCNFFYHRLVSGGIMVFDDYGFIKYMHSVKKAVDEFFSDKPEVPFSLRTGQCIAFKLANKN